MILIKIGAELHSHSHFEDAMSVLLHAAVRYLRPPYANKVHAAEKITSLKKKIMKFPVFNEAQKSINILAPEFGI